MEYDSLHDANFSVTAMTFDNGAIAERYVYQPYGAPAILDWNYVIDGTTDIGQTHLFTGRELDYETYLQLNRYRFHSPVLGRWINRDPIEYWGG